MRKLIFLILNVSLCSLSYAMEEHSTAIIQKNGVEYDVSKLAEEHTLSFNNGYLAIDDVNLFRKKNNISKHDYKHCKGFKTKSRVVITTNKDKNIIFNFQNKEGNDECWIINSTKGQFYSKKYGCKMAGFKLIQKQ